MAHSATLRYRRLRLCMQAAAASILALTALPSVCQTTSRTFPRYDVLAGLSTISTPALSLNQEGIQLQAGVNLHAWYTVGLDLGSVQGDAPVVVGELPRPKRNQLEATIAQLQAAGLLPAGYQYRANSHVATNLFSFGPQFSFRARRGLVAFCHPGLGGLRSEATFRGTDAFSTAVLLQSLPTGKKVDWTPFYGAGGGFDVPVGPRFGIHSELDINYSHPFNDQVANGAWSYRYSTGLRYGFGHATAKLMEAH